MDVCDPGLYIGAPALPHLLPAHHLEQGGGPQHTRQPIPHHHCLCKQLVRTPMVGIQDDQEGYLSHNYRVQYQIVEISLLLVHCTVYTLFTNTLVKY